MEHETQFSDEQLARRMFDGDAQAARQLLDRYKAPLFATLLKLTRDRADAEDIFQDTFCRAIRAGSTYKRHMRFRPWIFAIALNLARDRNRRRNHPAAPSPTRTGILPEPMPAAGEETSDAPALRQSLGRAIAALPDAQAEVVVLRFFQGFDEAEIARAAHIPRGTVKSRLYHAVRKLREILLRDDFSERGKDLVR